MKIIVYDIESRKRCEGQALDLPEGFTLNDVFERDKQLSDFAPCIVQARIDGVIIPDWRTAPLSKDATVQFDVLPSAAIPAIVYTIIQIVLAVISVILTIVSMFMTPDKPKNNRQDSANYSFEGISDTFAPGEPIPVVYGKDRKGGQVLMYYLTMLPDKTGLSMSMLLSLGEGPFDSIDDIEINEISASTLSSLTIATNLGSSESVIMDGFDIIKNTFHDGREITDELKNGVGAGRGSRADSKYFTTLIYKTVGYDVQQLEFYVAALKGLTCIGASAGKHHPQWSEYKIEYRDAGLGANECDQINWTTYGTRQVAGKDQRTYWDNAMISFPYASRWDVKLTWLRAKCLGHFGTANWQLWLQEVTEYRGKAPGIRNEALMSVRAQPTHELHGGRPTVTALVRGLKTDVYQNVNSSTNKWTQNPAWHVADYMTNSRYGMGAYIQRDELDIQSFLDFATLADSLVNTCEKTSASTFGAAGNCDGTPNFHTGDPPRGDGGFHGFFFVDPDDCIGVWSKKDGVQQYGICLTRMCCPPLGDCWGVFSGEATCEAAEVFIQTNSPTPAITINTGSPIFGLCAYVASGSSPDTFTGYAVIYDHGSHTLNWVRYNQMPVNTYGTILMTLPYSYRSDHVWSLLLEPAYTGWPSASNSKNWYTEDDTNIWMTVGVSHGFLDTFIETKYIDTSSLRITKGGCGGIAEQGLNGLIVLPQTSSGDFHGAHLENFGHECQVCYGACGQAQGGCPCNTNSSAGHAADSGTAMRHWDNTCQPRNARFNEAKVPFIAYGNTYGPIPF